MGQAILRLKNAVLIDADKHNITIRGWIDPRTIDAIKIPEYQREELKYAESDELKDAVEKGETSPIVLAMRGYTYKKIRSLGLGRGNVFELQNEVYVVDGLQRLAAARALRKAGRTFILGVTLFVGTDEAYEREYFLTLNTRRNKLSANVIARNLRHEFFAILLLYNLTKENSLSVLAGRVCWQQRKVPGNVISAATLLTSIGRLYGIYTDNVTVIASKLQEVLKRVGTNNFSPNVQTFYNMVDEVWGIRELPKILPVLNSPTWLKTNFLNTLAGLLENYRSEFWVGDRLKVNKETKERLKSFPFDDEEIINLAGSVGLVGSLLYERLAEHMGLPVVVREKQAA